MVITENYRVREDGVQLVRTYSSQNFKLLQEDTGAIYDEAIDISTHSHVYVETDELIDDLIEEVEGGEK